MPEASSQSMPQTIRHSIGANALLLVEDHQGYREVVRTALCSYLPDFKVVAVEGVETALAALGERGFEVMVTDMTLSDGTAMELLDQAGSHIAAGMKVIVISGHDSREMQLALNRDDVHAHVSKESGIKALVRAVQGVAGGDHTFSS